MSGYRDDGCGGGNRPAWHAAVDRENESYRDINEKVAKSAYADLKAKYDEALKALDNEGSYNQRLREALQDIASTAQAASQHEPEQFCEWAFNRAAEALNPSSESNTALKNNQSKEGL